MDTRATTPAGRGRTFNLLHTAPSLSSSSSVASSLIPEFFTYSKGKYGITYHYVDTRRMLIFPLNRFKKLQSPTYFCASCIRWSCTRTAADASHLTSQVMYLLMSLHLFIVLNFSQVFNLFHLVSYYRMQFVRNEHLLSLDSMESSLCQPSRGNETNWTFRAAFGWPSRGDRPGW